MTTDQPTLRERLQAGPGSRELSDAFLLEMGCDRPNAGVIPSRYDDWYLDGEYLGDIDPSQVTDDALAMVPEGWRIVTACQATGPGRSKDEWALTLGILDPQSLDFEHMVKGSSAGGLPCAICLAILAAKEADGGLDK